MNLKDLRAVEILLPAEFRPLLGETDDYNKDIKEFESAHFYAHPTQRVEFVNIDLDDADVIELLKQLDNVIEYKKTEYGWRLVYERV